MTDTNHMDSKHSLLLLNLFRNLTSTLSNIRAAGDAGAADPVRADDHYNDGANAWLYILFVLMFYAFSIVVLMVKYIRWGLQ